MENVAFLIEHGFCFQRIYDQSIGGEQIPYPQTLEEAKEFDIKYSEYAYE